MAPFTIMSSESLAEFVPPIPMSLGSARLQALVTAVGGRKKITSTRGHIKSLTKPIAVTTTCLLWFFMPEAQQIKTGIFF